MQRGLIDEDTAKDLLHEAEELAKKADEGEFHTLPEIVAKLREKIDERERDRRIDPAFATQLREAVAEIEAALGG